MDLLSQLSADMKTALKAKDRTRLDVIRMLLSDAQTADMKKITPLQAVEAYAKKLAKSREEFEKYGKADEVTKLTAELEIVNGYLPKKASVMETEALVEQFMAANAFTPQQAGQAIGAFMKANGANVDPAVASQIIRKKLG